MPPTTSPGPECLVDHRWTPTCSSGWFVPDPGAPAAAGRGGQQVHPERLDPTRWCRSGRPAAATSILAPAFPALSDPSPSPIAKAIPCDESPVPLVPRRSPSLAKGRSSVRFTQSIDFPGSAIRGAGHPVGSLLATAISCAHVGLPWPLTGSGHRAGCDTRRTCTVRIPACSRPDSRCCSQRAARCRATRILCRRMESTSGGCLRQAFRLADWVVKIDTRLPPARPRQPPSAGTRPPRPQLFTYPRR